MEVSFYKHDTYLIIRRKFTGAWANLRIELHRDTNRFWKEGYDEYEDDECFFPSDVADELLFTLNGETTKDEAERLFSKHYSYHGKPGDYVQPSIYGNFAEDITYPQKNKTLDECNNPFILALNRYPYEEFKRRFIEHWTNLRVEVYQTDETNTDALDFDNAEDIPVHLQELADDFNMNNLTRVNRLVSKETYELDGERYVNQKRTNEAVLRDEIYCSSFEYALRNSGIVVLIRNERLGVYWERNSAYPQLKQFQDAEATMSSSA